MLRLEVSARWVFLLVLALILAVVLFTVLVKVWSIILIFLVSLMLAAALLPVMEWLVRRHLPRGVAVLVLVLAALLVVALAGFVAVPVIADQVTALVDKLPELRVKVVDLLKENDLEKLAKGVEEFEPADYIGPVIASTGPELLGVLATVLTIVTLTAYILIDVRAMERALYEVAPDAWHPHIRYLLRELKRVVGGYIRGQFTTSFCIALFTFLLLTVMRVPNAAALALVAAVADCIPVVGLVFVTAPVAVAAYAESPVKGIIAAVAMLAYIQFENQVLVQLVYGASLSLPAVAVFLGILIGGTLLGVAGALLALPATATVKVLIQYWLDLRAGRIHISPTGEAIAQAEPAA